MRRLAAVLLLRDGRFAPIPVQTRLTEPTGDRTTLRFANVLVNGALPDSAFELALPKDVSEVQ